MSDYEDLTPESFVDRTKAAARELLREHGFIKDDFFTIPEDYDATQLNFWCDRTFYPESWITDVEETGPWPENKFTFDTSKIMAGCVFLWPLAERWTAEELAAGRTLTRTHWAYDPYQKLTTVKDWNKKFKPKFDQIFEAHAKYLKEHPPL